MFILSPLTNPAKVIFSFLAISRDKFVGADFDTTIGMPAFAALRIISQEILPLTNIILSYRSILFKIQYPIDLSIALCLATSSLIVSKVLLS